MRLVVVYHAASRFALALFMLILFVLALTAAGLASTGWHVAALLVGGFVVLASIPLAYELYSRRVHLSRIRRAIGLIAGLEGDVVVFSRPLRVKPVVIASRGRWIHTGRSSTYTYRVSVLREGNPVVADRVALRGDYGAVIEGRGVGAVILPGLLVEEPGLKGVVIALLPAEPPVFKGTSLSVSSNHGDYAVARIEEGPGLRGTLEPVSLVRARASRLELRAGLEGFEARIVVAESRGPPTRFEHILAPSEPTLIVSHVKRLSPLALQEAIGARRVAWGTLPEYTVRLVLDMPFARDVYAEEALVKLREG